MTRIIFVRHGESTGNLYRRFLGQTDGPLTDKGRLQASKTAEYLHDTHIDIAYASDLVRAYETGCTVAAPHGLEVIPDKALREINAGDWENCSFDELFERFPDSFKIWCEDVGSCCPDNGESVAAVFDRVIAAVWRIAEENDGKTVLIATHATPLRSLRCDWLGLGVNSMKRIESPRNASVSIVDYDVKNHTVSVRLYDEASFMGDIVTALPKGY